MSGFKLVYLTLGFSFFIWDDGPRGDLQGPALLRKSTFSPQKRLYTRPGVPSSPSGPSAPHRPSRFLLSAWLGTVDTKQSPSLPPGPTQFAHRLLLASHLPWRAPVLLFRHQQTTKGRRNPKATLWKRGERRPLNAGWDPGNTTLAPRGPEETSWCNRKTSKPRLPFRWENGQPIDKGGRILPSLNQWKNLSVTGL